MMAHRTDYFKWLEQNAGGNSERWVCADARIPELAREWLGPRDWWWFGPVPAGRRIAIVSSRLSRLIDAHGTWLQALRAALSRVRDHDAVAVVGRESAGYEFVLRGIARQEGLAICLYCCDLKFRTAAVWGRRLRARLDDATSGPMIELWALPPRLAPDGAGFVATELSSIPDRDRAAIAWADEIMVLGLRTGGNLHRLLRERLTHPNPVVRLADLPGLQSARARDELLKLGAEPWKPVTAPKVVAPLAPLVGRGAGGEGSAVEADKQFHSNPSPQPSPRKRGEGVICAQPCGTTEADTSHDSPLGTQLLPLPSADRWDFLTHTTRACVGPWPGQSRDDYLDSLLDARPDADHSALEALLRIVSERRLYASGQAIRGRYPVVSFTGVPLAELPRLRVFRSHRGRWDFEPYGIAIRRRWLEERGTRRVVYGDEAVWDQLSVDDRPFFQLMRHRSTHYLNSSTSPRCSIDWSVEQEWRHVGDLDLRDLSADDAVVFVSTPDDTRRLLAVSPWPVTVLGTR